MTKHVSTFPFLIAPLFCVFSAGIAFSQSTAKVETDDVPLSQLVDNRTESEIPIGSFVERLAYSQVVVLGEQHDNDSGHEFQLRVIQELVQQGYPVAISMEQFERDVQGVLDDYLAGRIDESFFLAKARPWNNYQKHYRPIIEFAKENGLPVIAANLPHRIAAKIAKGESASAIDQTFVPRQFTAPKNGYWDRFRATMEGHVGAGGMEKLEQFYASQCMKDDAMAESITDFLDRNSHRDYRVVHLCGHFHSDYGRGTVARLLSRRPLVQTLVVTMESKENRKKKKGRGEVSMSVRAHYTLWTAPNPTDDTLEE